MAEEAAVKPEERAVAHAVAVEAHDVGHGDALPPARGAALEERTTEAPSAAAPAPRA